MKKKALLIGLLLISISVLLSAQDIKTPGEKCDYTRYTQYPEISGFLSTISSVSPNLVVKTIAKTDYPNDYNEKRNIYLAIITEKGIASPNEVDREKPTILYICSQHGNEQSGKEAALLLIRELTLGKLKPLLSKVNVLIIPQMNPYGNENDTRRNEQNLDMNRDHIKLESPEVEAAHRVFIRWLPEVTLDVHEMGPSYYQENVGVVSNLNIDQRLQDFSRGKVLPYIEGYLKKKGYTFHEYLVRQILGINAASGANYGLMKTPEKPVIITRYSTTDINDGRNSFGIFNTLSFILEGASDHRVATLKERTLRQYEAMVALLKFVAENKSEIKKLVTSCRRKLIEQGKRFSPRDLVHLRMEYVADPEAPPLVLKRLVPPEPGLLGFMKTDKKKGEKITRDEIIPLKRGEMKVVTYTVPNWRPKVVPRVSVVRPLGYIIPADRSDIVATLLRLGVRVNQVMEDKEIEVEYYRVKEIIPARFDYNPPKKIEVEPIRSKIVVKKGSFVVYTSQLAGNLVPILLEPASSYGLIRYFKYRLVPKAGDIFPIYRLVNPVKLEVIPYMSWLFN
ncbi:MAG: DUF2817 domain-containing protein [Acidobacteria bacterium]|nr:DUF2817 domain-containing protein [Acidobacteriota bacterium]